MIEDEKKPADTELPPASLLLLANHKASCARSNLDQRSLTIARVWRRQSTCCAIETICFRSRSQR